MKSNGFFLDEKNFSTNKPTSEIHVKVNKPEGKVRLHSENSLPLHPLNVRVYRVDLRFSNEKQSLGYEVKVKTKPLSNRSVAIKYKKNYFFTDGKTPNRLIDQLAIECTHILYPIGITVNYDTNIKRINNLAEIKQKFEQQLPTIQRNYKGNNFVNYIQEIQRCLADPNLFNQRLLHKDLFLALYTHPLYQSYPQSRELESNIMVHVPDVSYPLMFTGKLKIDENYNCMRGFYIHFQGSATSLSGQVYELYVEYNMDYIDYTIKDILAEVKTVIEDNKIVLYKMTCYQLREEESSSKEKQLQHVHNIQKQKEKEQKEEENYQKYMKSQRSWISKLFNL